MSETIQYLIDDDNLPDSTKLKFVKHRPLFVSSAQHGAPISPNLAGRLAASFALCCQVFNKTRPQLASQCFHAATTVWAHADVREDRGKDALLTASPFDYYPETQFRDDLEWGATELYRAAFMMSSGDALQYAHKAGHWASLYIQSNDQDALNLYDVAPLAHYQLYKLLKENPSIKVCVPCPICLLVRKLSDTDVYRLGM